jgi:hypothetical protein
VWRGCSFDEKVEASHCRMLQVPCLLHMKMHVALQEVNGQSVHCTAVIRGCVQCGRVSAWAQQGDKVQLHAQLLGD